MAFEVDTAGYTLRTKTLRVLPCSLVRVDPLDRLHQRACATATRNWVVGNDRMAAATGEDIIVIGGFGYSKDPVDPQFSSSWLRCINDKLFPRHFHIPTSTSYYSPHDVTPLYHISALYTSTIKKPRLHQRPQIKILTFRNLSHNLSAVITPIAVGINDDTKRCMSVAQHRFCIVLYVAE